MSSRRDFAAAGGRPGAAEYSGRRGAVVGRSPAARPGRVRTFWNKHQDIVGNAGSLVATTGVTAALGFAYLAVAARFFSQQSVGYGSSTISMLTLFGTVGMFGLGTVLIAELSQRDSYAGLTSAALLACGAGSMIFGATFAIIAAFLGKGFAGIGGSPLRAGLFVLGVTLTGVTLVFDQATIGLLRGGLQLTRNAAFSTIKLAMLPIAAFMVRDAYGSGIVLTWVIGTALSMLPVMVRLRITKTPLFGKPDWQLLRSVGRVTMAHNWLNLALQVPGFAMPMLVTVAVSPSAAAAFYVASMLSNFLYIIPTHLSTVLFAIGAGDKQRMRRELRFTLRVSFLLGIPGMAVLIVGAHFVLGFFGPGYIAAATLPLTALTLGYLPTVFKSFYIAVRRSAGKVSQAAAVVTPLAVVRMVASTVAGLEFGLKGLAYALLAIQLIECTVTAPAVVRAAYGGGRHRRAERGRRTGPGTVPVRPATGSPRDLVAAQAAGYAGDHSARQEQGLAMLLSLAGTVPSSPDGWSTLVGMEHVSGLRSGQWPPIDEHHRH